MHYLVNYTFNYTLLLILDQLLLLTILFLFFHDFNFFESKKNLFNQVFLVRFGRRLFFYIVILAWIVIGFVVWSQSWIMRRINVHSLFDWRTFSNIMVLLTFNSLLWIYFILTFQFLLGLLNYFVLTCYLILILIRKLIYCFLNCLSGFFD